MKSLVEYIAEQSVDTTPQVNESEDVWVVKDVDLDGAILDVCDTEDGAKAAKEQHLKENSGANLEISTCKRSEVEKKED